MKDNTSRFSVRTGALATRSSRSSAAARYSRTAFLKMVGGSPPLFSTRRALRIHSVVRAAGGAAPSPAPYQARSAAAMTTSESGVGMALIVMVPPQLAPPLGPRHGAAQRL
eukprot:3911202-Lingulodinium_polyedra.AAC.1